LLNRKEIYISGKKNVIVDLFVTYTQGTEKLACAY
jgi:hypothetical protein